MVFLQFRAALDLQRNSLAFSTFHCAQSFVWTCPSCFLHFRPHFLSAQKMMANRTGRMMALTASTSGKLAQGPMNEDIAVITSQPVLLNECVSRFFGY